MINLLKWLPALATALAMLLAQRSLMHDFQLESYQFPGYFRTLRRNWKRALLPGVTLAAYLTLLYLAYRSIDRMLDMSVGKILLALVNAALAVAGGWWCRSIFQQKKAKKPFGRHDARQADVHCHGRCLHAALHADCAADEGVLLRATAAAAAALGGAGWIAGVAD